IAPAPPGVDLVEKVEIPCRLDVVTKSLQRPDDHIAMGVTVLDGGIGLQHKPLGPVATDFILLRKYDPQNVFHGLVMLKRKQQFDRPLADVPGTPGSGGILFKAVWYLQM